MNDLTDEQRARALEMRNTFAYLIGARATEALPATHSHAWLAVEARVLASHACPAETVRTLHEPRVVEVLGPECSVEECDHEDDCPLVDYTVCGHCYDVGNGAHRYAYEQGGIENVAYPCPTITRLRGGE